MVEFAKSSRARCHSCSFCIGEGQLKFGTAVSNEGYLNMQWHHQECFWNKRVGKYFRRKGKKINYILKVDQFSNREVLSREEYEELIRMVLQTNLKHATKVALDKAGIDRPNFDGDDGGEELPVIPAAKKGRKRRIEETAIESEPVETEVTEQRVPVELDPAAPPSEGRMTRSRAKKSIV